MASAHLIPLQCPACHADSMLAQLPITSDIDCPACGTAYPFADGVLDLLPDDSSPRSTAQTIMESDWFINIYEKRTFRTGPGMTLIAGISFEEEYKILCHSARLKDSPTILDVCCGSGLYTRRLARDLPTHTLVGLDLSRPMLAYNVAHQEGALDNIALIHGSALALPFPNNSCDAAISGAALHLFPPDNRAALLREIARVLRPGSRVSFAALRNWSRSQTMKRWLAKLSARTGTYYLREEDMADMLEGAGFVDIECLHAQRYWLIMSGATSA